MYITPIITKAVPHNCGKVNDSPSTMLAKAIVEIGPTPPKIAALLAPIRLIPIEIKNDGTTVAKIAITKA